MKLQGFEKPKTVMLSIVKAHEKNVTWTVVHQSTFLDGTIFKFLIIQTRLERFLRYHHLRKRKFLLSILRLQAFRRNTEVYEQSWRCTTGELENRSVRMDRLNTFLMHFEPA
jgi:hypothetical protein